MRIEIDLSLTEDLNAHQWLDRIMHKIYDGWHIWHIGTELDPSTIKASSWVRGRKYIKELLRKSIERNAWDSNLHRKRIRVTSVVNHKDEFAPEDAAKFAELPLWIIVENRISDGKFVKRILKELFMPLYDLLSKSGPPIVFDSMGGLGQMLQLVELKIDEAYPGRPRIVVIADSDKKHPSDSVGNTVEKLIEACKDHKISYWILAKREAENYLTLGLLKAWKANNSRHSATVNAWNRLSDDQKDYYNMKKGFQNSYQSFDRLMGSLFQGISEIDYDNLKRGFGRDVYLCWDCSSSQIKTEILARSRGDLERGIDMINQEV